LINVSEIQSSRTWKSPQAAFFPPSPHLCLVPHPFTRLFTELAKFFIGYYSQRYNFGQP